MRMKGVLKLDDSSIGKGVVTAGGEMPQPDPAELTDAPEVGSLIPDYCPVPQEGGFAPSAAAEFTVAGADANASKKQRKPVGGFVFKAPKVKLDRKKVDARTLTEPPGKARASGKWKSQDQLESPLMFTAASANNYSIATPIGRLRWEMSLGSHARAMSLGQRVYEAEALDGTAFSPARVNVAAGSDPKNVISDLNGLRRGTSGSASAARGSSSGIWCQQLPHLPQRTTRPS
jgi:hypothetical protein